MPQKISPETMDAAINQPTLGDEALPALEGAEYYFALVNHQGKKVLCILDENMRWRPTSYEEMMKLL